ncbi:sugar ABC transporter permease [Blautia sp. An81]|uniref:carbohydrate ABC transporter permease n=1 Tax=Blautia sp. An81 TaxID=1965659 RepID=UPI002E8DF3EF|nr:sugar ABC transporter permease [Blautia sp. An81]
MRHRIWWTKWNCTWRNRRKQGSRKNCIKKQNKKKNLLPWLLLAPSLLGVGIFTLIPFADVFRRSFQKAVGTGFVGLGNYRTVLDNQAFQLAAGNTGRFLFVCLPLLLGLSLFVALLLERLGRKGNLLKSGFLLPMAVPAASVVLFWQLFFDREGILNHILEIFHIQGPDYMNSSGAFGVLVAVYIWKNLGYDMILWLSGLLGIPESLYEAARIDGAGEVQCFWFITRPLLVQTAFLTGTLSLVNAFKVFREAWMIAGNYPHDSIYMLQNLFNNWFTKLDMQKMTAGAVMLAAVLGIFLILCQKAEERWKQ